MKLITTQAPSAANVKETMVRKKRLGQKLGLKNPSQIECVASHSPGVSCQEMIPLIQKRLIQAPKE
jgi:hypothetical protein